MDTNIQGSKPRRHFPRKYAIILGLLLGVSLLGLIAVVVAQKHATRKNNKYGIVLDAGSSHTSMYTYQWPAEKANDTGVVMQIDMCEVKGPGISSYTHNPEKAGMSLQQCMDKAKVVVPAGKYQETPVYLGATAGMRLLRKQDKNVSEKVLSEVAATLRSYPFNFQGARILSGGEEGAYGWITVNYLLGNFKESVWPRFLPRPFSSLGTTGALDLGGASTQITFVPDQEKIESQGDIVNFYLYGKNYSVYTHSFLCYGKDQALRLKLVNDVQGKAAERYQDPCFHPGYKRTVKVSDLLTNPCTAGSLPSLPFSQIEIEGTGHYENCQASTQRIFNLTHCPYSKCSFNGIFLPPVQGEFAAFSAFYYVMNFLNVTKTPMDEAMQKIKAFCSTPWDEVKAEFPGVKEKYLSEYCFAGVYIMLLLDKSYHFTEENWSYIHFLEKIGDSDAGWTLGYMLNLTNMIPAETPYTHPLSRITYMSLLVICSLMMVALLLLGFLFFRQPKCMRKAII
ncbi:PREDICTED: ectonucleoside triphosphate diphosphohydrolase 1 [Gekko japonicus]|uniref:Ectonucleoside triphosphate diphosphohydrolase 1 n=1 Tax=Gekko japonicus TaxID=146911 RepID=A0ABM1L0K6_GEKJA|nr:PREDICTED: ectonucleoside triphosphate diphosphohydrolase 1 [Gekko japonicus]